MQLLRHEEFKFECEATCNGGYQNPWSKTMVGYGPEENNFALEIVYNYGINHYETENGLQFISIKSDIIKIKNLLKNSIY